ncbi:MAG: hypothetical protein JWP67_3002 [Mucilaginibacter sp.]|nr:hypothetical protein [Mucilaginibacter sp.]
MVVVYNLLLKLHLTLLKANARLFFKLNVYYCGSIYPERVIIYTINYANVLK